ncbi:MAG: hypothetical protein CMK07_00605, partial [Ponticaulis sp.]|nr:hypothetical protein [Ponticaulis sp.]
MFRTLLLAAAFSAVSLSPAALADELTPEEAKAREIYANVVSIRSARGQAKMHEVVDYLVSEFKAVGFTDDDIMVTDYDSEGEPVQGLMVWYRADDPIAEPIVLLAHMDVVDALQEDWVRDPFTLTEEEGYFFGRGTSDNKYGLTNLTQTFIRLKQEGWVPSRDLLLVFSGDEETGMVSTMAQAAWVDEHVKPAFVLNSDAGGLGLDEQGVPTGYSVQGAEKTYATFEITATNPGGHSSRPRADNAIYDLSRALLAIEGYKFPVNASPLTTSYLRDAGKKRLDQLGWAMRTFADDPTNEEAIARLRQEPSVVGTIGTTCVATMLRAGHAENALPQSATATVNCRIFPGEGVELTQSRLEEVIGNPDIQFKIIGDVTETPESGMRDDVMAAIELSLTDRGAEVDVVPYMSSGGTDGMHYRGYGYTTLGIGAGGSKPNDTFAHGLNER